MKKIFYILTALAVCLFLCVGVSAETDAETWKAVTETAVAAEETSMTADTEPAAATQTDAETTVEEQTVTEGANEADIGTEAAETEHSDTSTADEERAYWARLWGQITDWVKGHSEVIAFLTAAFGFIGSIVTLGKKSKSLIQMALALRREGEEKLKEAQEAIAVSRKETEAIAEENRAMQERILAAEEKHAKAMAGMAWCVERLFEESNLPTYKKDEIRAKYNEAVGGDGSEGKDQA